MRIAPTEEERLEGIISGDDENWMYDAESDCEEYHLDFLNDMPEDRARQYIAEFFDSVGGPIIVSEKRDDEQGPYSVDDKYKALSKVTDVLLVIFDEEAYYLDNGQFYRVDFGEGFIGFCISKISDEQVPLVAFEILVNMID